MKKTIIYGIISIIFILLLVVISYIIINKTARENAIDTILNTKAWMDITFSAKYKDLRNTDTTKTFYKSEKNIKIPMLLYHDIVEEEPERDLFYMYTTQEQFEKQISGLQELGYRFISMEELIQYNKNELALPEYVALICFDDGYTGNYLRAYPIAKKYQVPINIYVIDEMMEQPGYLTWAQAKEMADSGLVSINTHGKRHIHYEEISTVELVAEITYAHEQIEKHLGKKVRKVFTYPYGTNSKETREALKEAGFIQNLTDNKINYGKSIDYSGLHRIYVLNNESAYKIAQKIYDINPLQRVIRKTLKGTIQKMYPQLLKVE